ncbi:hypothetical protein AB0L06_40955 [Spirillospora sp. NPDC052269]
MTLGFEWFGSRLLEQISHGSRHRAGVLLPEFTGGRPQLLLHLTASLTGMEISRASPEPPTKYLLRAWPPCRRKEPLPFVDLATNIEVRGDGNVVLGGGQDRPSLASDPKVGVGVQQACDDSVPVDVQREVARGRQLLLSGLAFDREVAVGVDLFEEQ